MASDTKECLIMGLRTALTGLLVTVTFMVVLAAPVSANTVTGQGIVTGHKYRAGVPSKGGVTYAAGVQVNRDAAGAIVDVRATGNISKLRKVAKVQIDRVALGTATALVADNTTP